MIGESTPVLLQGRGVRQEANQGKVAAPCTKRVIVVGSVRSIVSVVEEAFYSAASGIPGPVFIEAYRCARSSLLLFLFFLFSCLNKGIKTC